jgi:hypothetical protein
VNASSKIVGKKQEEKVKREEKEVMGEGVQVNPLTSPDWIF